jgi:predicted ArsR family transcriptional regulator
LGHGGSLGFPLGAPGGCIVGELGNNSVVKFPGGAAERVARVLLEVGAATAVEVSHTLGTSVQATRRSLSALLDAGFVEAHERTPFGPTPTRGRGRPSGTYSLTPLGRSACDQSYDDLALQSLRFIDRSFGRDAVRAFAAERAARITSGGTIESIVEALVSGGYAATLEPASSNSHSSQLCQHHCPVVAAASEFPELCEEETSAFSAALGQHVTRLATLAQGDPICTTLIPNQVFGQVTQVKHQARKPRESREVSA